MPDCRLRFATFVFTSEFKSTNLSSRLITHTECKRTTPANFSLYGNETYQVVTKFSQAAVLHLLTIFTAPARSPKQYSQQTVPTGLFESNMLTDYPGQRSEYR